MYCKDDDAGGLCARQGGRRRYAIDNLAKIETVLKLVGYRIRNELVNEKTIEKVNINGGQSHE